MDIIRKKDQELYQFNRKKNGMLSDIASAYNGSNSGSALISSTIMLLIEYLMIRDGNVLGTKEITGIGKELRHREKERENHAKNRNDDTGKAGKSK